MDSPSHIDDTEPRGRYTVFFRDPERAKVAESVLAGLPGVLRAWVEPSIGVGLEFDPSQLAIAEAVAALRDSGLLPTA